MQHPKSFSFFSLSQPLETQELIAQEEELSDLKLCLIYMILPL